MSNYILSRLIKSIIKENISKSFLMPHLVDQKIKAARETIDSLENDDAKNEAAAFLSYTFHIKQKSENEITLKRISLELNKLSTEELYQKIIEYLQNSPTAFPISGFTKRIKEKQPFLSTQDIQQINSKKIQDFLKNDPITQNIYANKIIRFVNQTTLQNFFLK